MELINYLLTHYGGEYDDKMEIYAKLGVLYYVIYNPYYWQRDRHQPLEIYRLVNQVYQLQSGEPFWMSEIGLGIGRGSYIDGDSELEVLYWFDQQGNRYLTTAERAIQAEQKATEVEQRARQVEELLVKYRDRFGELPE